MKDMFGKVLIFFISRFMNGSGPYQGAGVNLARLNIAKGYLYVVKIFRLLFLSFLGAGVCLVFLLTGLFLLHFIILYYAPWDISVKIAVTLICAFFYILMAAGIFAYVFAEDRWMKMFNTDAIIKELTVK